MCSPVHCTTAQPALSSARGFPVRAPADSGATWVTHGRELRTWRRRTTTSKTSPCSQLHIQMNVCCDQMNIFVRLRIPYKKTSLEEFSDLKDIGWLVGLLWARGGIAGRRGRSEQRPIRRDVLQAPPWRYSTLCN